MTDSKKPEGSPYGADWSYCHSCGGDRLTTDLDDDGLCQGCATYEQHVDDEADRKRDAARFAKLTKSAAWWSGAHVVAAALKIDAMKLDEAGIDVKITNPQPVNLWYYDGNVQLPANTTLTVAGWHPPSGDDIFGYDGLELPAGPKGSNSANMRVRVKDENNNELLLTTQELAKSFEPSTAAPQEEEDLSQPGMPGESVDDYLARQRGETPQPTQPQNEQTNAQRPRPRAPTVPGDPSLTTQDLKAPTNISQRPQAR